MMRGIMALLLLCTLTFYNSFAQGPGGPCGDPDIDPDCWGGGDEDVPIDGGIGILLAAGAAYGLKKLHDKKREEHCGKAE